MNTVGDADSSLDSSIDSNNDLNIVVDISELSISEKHEKHEKPEIEALKACLVKAFKATSDSLKLLGGSDYAGDDSGLNETGLKFGLLGFLNMFLNQDFTEQYGTAEIISEFEFKEKNNARFADIVILLKKIGVAVVIELKYKRLGFVNDSKLYCYQEETVSEARARLNNAAECLLGLNEKELLDLKFKHYYQAKKNNFTNKTTSSSKKSSSKKSPSYSDISVTEEANIAAKQATDAKEYLLDSKIYNNVLCYSAIGIGNRLLCFKHGEGETEPLKF